MPGAMHVAPSNGGASEPYRAAARAPRTCRSRQTATRITARMRLRSLALLLALLPGLIAPVGMTWCTGLCTALRGGEEWVVATRSCCESESAPAPGPRFSAPCKVCQLAASPKSELQRHEAPVDGLALAPPTAAP